MDTGHLRNAHQHLVALRTQLDHVQTLLEQAVAAPVRQHHTAVASVVPVTRELRHHAMELAAHIGAAEAVR